MLQVLLVPLLSFHLLLIDLAMAGPLLCVWLEWRQSRNADDRALSTARALARCCNRALLLGMVVGGLLLAARWWFDDGVYFQALATVPVSRLWWGGAELVFSAACLAAYELLWDRLQGRRWLHRLLAIFASTNLLMHFPALFVIISVLTTRGELLGEPLDRSGYQRLLIDGEVLSRVTHIWLAALAVAAVMAMTIARRPVAAVTQGMSGEQLIRRTAWLALAATVLQIPTGLWVTWQLPLSVRDDLIGGDLMTSGFFLMSLAVSLPLINTLAAIALGDPRPQLIRRCAVLLSLLVLLMVATRQSAEARSVIEPTASIHLEPGSFWRACV